MSTDLRETHSGGVVQVVMPPGARFGIVPRALLEDERLGLDTRAVAAWLSSQPEGFQIVVHALRKRMGLGEDRWARIAKELEAEGYLTRSCSPSGRAGRWVWHITFNPCPTVPGSTVPGSSGYGGSGHGAAEPGATKNRGRQQKNHQSKDNNGTTTQAAPPPGVRAHKEVLRSGVVVWTDQDRQTESRLLEQYGAAAVAAAATTLQAQGADPLPGRVSKILGQARQQNLTDPAYWVDQQPPPDRWAERVGTEGDDDGRDH